MRIVFMGTPELSRTVLQALCEAGHEIVLVITQPDRVKGRGKKLQLSPVREEAVQRGLACFQPERLRTEENIAYLEAFLKEHPADVGVVAAFGQILPKAVLELPKFGCLNIHTSLLPKYRGASPIEQVILAGEKTTGVTVMQMDEGLDTGDILLQEPVDIEPEETAESLSGKLAVLGGQLIVRALDKLQEGTLPRRPQAGESSYFGLIRKEDGQLNFARPAERLERQIRAFTPWPGSYSFLNGRRMKITRALVLPAPGVLAEAGSIVKADAEGIDIACGEGILRVLSLQPEGKKEMETAAFLRGCRVNVQDRFEMHHE